MTWHMTRWIVIAEVQSFLSCLFDSQLTTVGLFVIACMMFRYVDKLEDLLWT
jgi:hypothetical protein